MAEIVTYPDERLHKKCVECDVNDKSLVRLSKEMAKKMYDNNGVGLAAPQIGDDRRIIVVDCDYDVDDKKTRDPLILLNPELLDCSGEKIEETEGCLSCPGISVPVTRYECVKVHFWDLKGDEWELQADGLLARCLQHEVDHLNGKTLFEACDPQIRLQVLKMYEQAKQAGAQPGETSYVIEPNSNNKE